MFESFAWTHLKPIESYIMPHATYTNRLLSSLRWETQWNLLNMHVAALSERSLEGMRRFDRVFISFTESLPAFNGSMFCSLSSVVCSSSSDLRLLIFSLSADPRISLLKRWIVFFIGVFTPCSDPWQDQYPILLSFIWRNIPHPPFLWSWCDSSVVPWW